MKATSLMVCVVLATGCTRSDSEKVGKTTLTSTTATNLAPTTSFVETDPLLTRSVEVALAVDPQRSMAAKNVEVSVEEGVATLDGTVTDVKTLRELEATVSEVPGVRAVNDRLEVSTLRDRDGDESDDRIAFALQRSFASLQAAGNDVDKISIDVLGGHVALRGATASAEVRDSIEALTEKTPGVVAVNDELISP